MEIDDQRELLDLECAENDKKMGREKHICELAEDCLRRRLEERQTNGEVKTNIQTFERMLASGDKSVKHQARDKSTRTLSLSDKEDNDWKIELKTTIKLYYKDFFLDDNEKKEIKMLLFDHEKNSKELYEILGDMGWSKEEWRRGFKDEHAAHNMMMSPEPGVKKAKGDYPECAEDLNLDSMS